MRGAAPVLPVILLVALLALPVPSGGEGSGGGTIADAASGLVVLYAMGRAVRTARRPLTRTAAVVLGLPVVGIAVAAVGASTVSAGVTGLVRYLQIFVLVPAAVLMLVRDRRDFRVVAWSLIGLALFQGAFGVYQYVTGTGATYMGSDIRAVGTFGASDVMGMATVVSYGMVCAVALALGPAVPKRLGPSVSKRLGSSAPTQRQAALVCALLLVVPLALSFSRGAWIATAVACGAQLAFAGARRALKALAALTALAVVLVGGFGIGTAMLQERITSITQVADAPDQSVTDRYTMWAAAVDMWRDKPLAGVGLKAFPDHRDSHASLALSSGSDTGGAGAEFRRQPLLSPHNMYLLILSEQGLLGLCALVGSWGACLLLGVRRLSRVRGGPGGMDCALVACGLLGWQLVDFVYADIGGPSTVLMAVVLGLAAWWALSRRALAGEVPR
ncbi:O-antigen ligase family protein [Streptomyces sp. NPDC050658]|uniref:O-antigen ligase family protein n=1 Tax=unclassified Streptomyces TaxID=2593676 RepID=UPI003415CA8D